MFKVKYDMKKNRVQVVLSGVIKHQEAIEYREACEKVHKRLKDGATFLLNAKELMTLPQDSLEEIQKVRIDAVRSGVVKGAMIVSDKILIMQSKRTARKIDGFHEEQFIDISEAEAFLDA